MTGTGLFQPFHRRERPGQVVVADGAAREIVKDDCLAGEGEVVAWRARVDQVPVPEEHVSLLRQEDGSGQAVLRDRALDRRLVPLEVGRVAAPAEVFGRYAERAAGEIGQAVAARVIDD